MFQLRRILFPVDFSDRCRGAAAHVEALVGRFQAELILLHVIGGHYNSTLEDSPSAAMKHLDRFFGNELKQLQVRKLVSHGEPAHRIVQCATENQVDLIMLPTQGMGIYRRLILGSTSAKVLHDADCPVWTGVHLENAPALEKVSTRRIVCAVDLKAASRRVLDWANHLAAEYQAELHLIHISANPAARDALEKLQAEAGSAAQIHVGSGDVTHGVTRFAADHQADLLVIGRKAEAGVLGRLEMTAYSLIRQSPCPVLSV